MSPQIALTTSTGVAVLLAERAVQVDKSRSRPETAPSTQALPALDDLRKRRET